MNTLQCISPIDGKVVAERPVLSSEQAHRVVLKAKQAQSAWARVPLSERKNKVLAGIEALASVNDVIVDELACMMGRPVRYGGEIGGVRERAQYMASIASQALLPTIIEASAQFERRIEREPQGVVFVVAPWNYPYMTAINTLAPALIAGNSVVLKHSTQTLLAGERLVQAFDEAGLPSGVLQNVFLDHSMAAELIAAKSFDFINFTGSVGGGQAIERAAAGTFTGVGLELGGKDPAYVADDADIDAAVATLIDGAMFNSGQCCCGIERIYVHQSHYQKFVDAAVATAEGYSLGNPLEQETTLGPMANIRFAQEVRQQIQEAVGAGAHALIDRKQFSADSGEGTYLMPQILTEVNHSMRVMRDESFGPVVGIMPVRDDAEAIHLMNDSDFGLTASLWTQDAQRAALIGSQLETGTVFMNRADYLDPALCWTGCKNTGRGGALSHIGYQHLTRPKSYHMKKEIS